ncbi:MAG TPA: hypothetical protein VGS22_10490 [Thermoanaerobaculia bacterium]|jgi:uncharacterized membrane protein|nr:hypothetical protein [Thermoanaerobaculia bacterium]
MDVNDQDSPTESPFPPSPPYRDRSTAILLMGLFVALIGLACLGMVALMAVGVGAASAMSPGQGAPFRSTIPAMALYLAVAAFFLTTGIGSAMVRRWARALLSVVSWMWLTVGVIALIVVTALLPKIRTMFEAAMPHSAPAAPAGLMVGCMVVALIVVYVALPVPLALFYSGVNVRATFEARDRPRWTDRLPTPLLGLFLVLAFWGFTALEMPLYGAFPVLGRLFSGASSWAFGLVFAAATGAGAWWVWRRSILGWWVAVALWVFAAVSSTLTFAGNFDWNAYYVQMGLTEQQIQMTRGFSPEEMFANPLVVAIVVLTWLGIGAFLFWIKKLFAPPRALGPAV